MKLAEEVRQRLASANRAGPAKLVRPNLAPTHRRIAAFDNHRTEHESGAIVRNPMAKLIIIRQIVGQRIEAPDARELLPRRGHDCPEREVQRLERLRLQDLTPKIRIDRESFPTHSQAGRTGHTVKAIHQTAFLSCQWLEESDRRRKKFAILLKARNGPCFPSSPGAVSENKPRVRR